MLNERTRRDSFLNVLHQTQYSVYYVVHEEQTNAVSIVYTWSVWTMTHPPFGNQERLAFDNSGFPKEARVINLVH